jgi:polysaccharide biosynthesis/export protein
VCSLALLLVAPGCASTVPFTWYTQLPQTEWVGAQGDYVIGVGDVIDIRVFDQASVSLSGRIRRDGRIAVPILGEVMAAGKRPGDLSRELELRLKEFIVSPRVIVNIIESVPITVSLVGEVSAKGTMTLSPPATLLQALAQAGGLSEFADDEAIYVVRKTPTFQRIRFTYDALLRNSGGAATFPLRSGDVVMVE